VTNKTSNQIIEEIFRHNLKVDGLTIKVENLKTEEVPAMVILSEQMRRFKELTALYERKAPTDLMQEHTLVVNGNSKIIKLIKSKFELSPGNEQITTLCEHVYDLALISQGTLPNEKMQKFVERSTKLLLFMN
ncbi:molecular chaperone HtpG, partial [bacterium]|nr:molecular chaperone HtpG [bacterium]